MHLLLDTMRDKHFVGDTYFEVAHSTGLFHFDFENRKVTLKSHPDVCASFTDEWGHDELVPEFGRAAIRILTNRCSGFVLYRHQPT